MKKNAYILLFFSIMVFLSCGNNEPRIKTVLDGTWKCEETSSLSEPRTYLVDFDHLSKDTTQYFISNFYKVDSEDGVIAKFSPGKLQLLDSQQIGFTSVGLRSGSGTVSSDFKQIVLNYKIFDGSNDIDVHAVYSR